MPLEVRDCKNLQFLEPSASMRNFDFVDDVLQDFRLNGPVRLEISTFAQEAHDPVALLDRGFVVPVEARVTNNFRAVFAFLGVDRDREASSTPQQFGQLLVPKLFLLLLRLSLRQTRRVVSSGRMPLQQGLLLCLFHILLLDPSLGGSSPGPRFPLGCLAGWLRLGGLEVYARGQILDADGRLLDLEELAVDGGVGEEQAEAVVEGQRAVVVLVHFE